MDDNLILRLAMLVLVFGAAVLTFLAVAPLFAQKIDLRQRLASPGGDGAIEMRVAQLRADSTPTLWSRLIHQIEANGLSLDDTKSDALRQRLTQAGYTASYAPRLFVLLRVAATLILPILGLAALFLLTDQPPTATKLYLALTALAVIGLYMPNLWVSAKAARRSKELLNGFPDMLDLMLVCVEAGLGIDACFNRVGSEMSRSHPLLAEQLAMLTLELRAGRSREDALRQLVKRTGVAEISAFATLMIQSDKLGSSIATTLKIYGVEMREARRMRAEEKAHRLPVLLSIPLVVFMLPTMMSVLMLPGIITVVRDLIPSLAGR